MDISVIVPVYRDWNRLALCLESLSNQLNDGTYNYDVFVVNNDPHDDVPIDIRMKFPCFIFLTEGKPGSYAARNKALAICSGELIAFTDSDCIPKNDWLITAKNYLLFNKEYDRVGGSIEMLLSGGRPSLAEIYEKIYAFRQKAYILNKGVSVTANLIVRRSVLDKIGLFNDDLMSGGDFEWGERAANSDINIGYCEELVVMHPARSKMSQLILKTRREAGGVFNVTNPSFSQFLFQILLGLLPPLNSAFEVMTSRKFSVLEKIVGFAIRYFLRLVVTYETILLYFKVKSPERV